jgi:hypothetical protein
VPYSPSLSEGCLKGCPSLLSLWGPQGARSGLPVIGIVPLPWTRILYKDGDARETPIALVEPFPGTTSGAGNWAVQNHQGGPLTGNEPLGRSEAWDGKAEHDQGRARCPAGEPGAVPAPGDPARPPRDKDCAPPVDEDIVQGRGPPGDPDPFSGAVPGDHVRCRELARTKPPRGDPLREMCPWGVRSIGTGRPSTTKAGPVAQPGNPGPC